MTTGVEYRRNLRQDQDSYDVDPFVSNVDSHYRSNQAAIYAQDEIQLHRRLTATVGGRYDWWSLTGGTVTPRVGLVYRTDADTAIKALYGEAYRAPTVYETYYYPDPFGRTLRPERLRTSEVVYEQYLGGTLRLHRDRLRRRKARNLISQGADYYFENREQARSRGVEVEAERRWTSGILLRGSYVAQRTWIRSPTSSCRTRRAGWRWSTRRRRCGAGSSRSPPSRSTSAIASRRWARTSTACWLTNLNVTFVPPRRPLSFAARVSNLFDTRLRAPGRLRVPPGPDAAGRPQRLGARDAAFLSVGRTRGAAPRRRHAIPPAALTGTRDAHRACRGHALARATIGRDHRCGRGTGRALHLRCMSKKSPSRDVRGSRPTVGGPGST